MAWRAGCEYGAKYRVCGGGHRAHVAEGMTARHPSTSSGCSEDVAASLYEHSARRLCALNLSKDAGNGLKRRPGSLVSPAAAGRLPRDDRVRAPGRQDSAFRARSAANPEHRRAPPGRSKRRPYLAPRPGYRFAGFTISSRRSAMMRSSPSCTLTMTRLISSPYPPPPTWIGGSLASSRFRISAGVGPFQSFSK